MKKFGKLASMAVATALSTAAVANAGSVALIFEDANGNSVDSGWVASWSEVFDPYLSVNPADGVVLQDGKVQAVSIEKFYNFTQGPDELGIIDPVVIVFQQVSDDAADYILINDEQLVNNTGTPWGGFRMTIQGGSTGTDEDVRFDSEATIASGFSTSPFETAEFSQNDQILTLSDGVVPTTPPDNVFLPGNPGSLYIVAAKPTNSGARRVFALKEQPLPIPIPLPAAAWAGIACLAGLGAIRYAKRVRKA